MTPAKPNDRLDSYPKCGKRAMCTVAIARAYINKGFGMGAQCERTSAGADRFYADAVVQVNMYRSISELTPNSAFWLLVLARDELASGFFHRPFSPFSPKNGP